MSTKTETKSRPTHAIWQVIGDGEDAFWTRIGSMWTNRDGKGFTPVFNSFPATGRLAIREIRERETPAKAGRK